MSDPRSFALAVLISAGIALLAVLSNRITARLRVPAPALFLVAASAFVTAVPDVRQPSSRSVQRIVTVALVLILFDGGMHLGWERVRAVLRPILVLGVAGTFATAVVVAATLHLGFAIPWYAAMLAGAALAPTDPAVVFSVLGNREVIGPTGLIIEGESGANDPVGIALVASLVSAGGIGAGALGAGADRFLLEMAVGAAVGVGGGLALLWFMRHVPLPSEGLYPLRTAACALLLYGAATVAHGSGFLAVFAAGVAVGDERAPYKREIERFHGALASLSEIVAFVVLGLQVDARTVLTPQVWVPGVVAAAVLAAAARPAVVAACLARAGISTREKAFVAFAGLKGAVPILLATMIFGGGVPGASRLYGIVVVAVVLSVLVQGTLTPVVARWLSVHMRTVEPEPWALGMRLRHEPRGVHRIRVREGASAVGSRLGDVGLGDDVWVSFAVRGGRLLPVAGETTFQPGDELLVLAPPDKQEELQKAFTDR